MRKYILLIVLLFTFSCDEQEKIPYRIDFKNNDVTNFTKWEEVDKLTHFGLDKLNVDRVSILITHIPTNIIDQYKQQNEDVLEGFIVEISLDRFHILLNRDLNDTDVKRVVFHELIHLKQTHSGRLINCDNEIVEFNQKPYYVNYIPYRYRLWETESFKYQNYLISLNNFYE